MSDLKKCQNLVAWRDILKKIEWIAITIFLVSVAELFVFLAHCYMRSGQFEPASINVIANDSYYYLTWVGFAQISCLCIILCNSIRAILFIRCQYIIFHALNKLHDTPMMSTVDEEKTKIKIVFAELSPDFQKIIYDLKFNLNSRFCFFLAMRVMKSKAKKSKAKT